METQAEKHPIQNLLDEVDNLEIADEFKAHLKEELMTAYATGYLKGGK